jgi:hypothetical protein
VNQTVHLTQIPGVESVGSRRAMKLPEPV